MEEADAQFVGLLGALTQSRSDCKLPKNQPTCHTLVDFGMNNLEILQKENAMQIQCPWNGSVDTKDNSPAAEAQIRAAEERQQAELTKKPSRRISFHFFQSSKF